jgi:hypothetical protein
MAAAAEAAPHLGTAGSCLALGVARATFYRRKDAGDTPPAPRPSPPRTLGAPERQEVLDILHAPEFVDSSPAEVYHTLLAPRAPCTAF